MRECAGGALPELLCALVSEFALDGGGGRGGSGGLLRRWASARSARNNASNALLGGSWLREWRLSPASTLLVRADALLPFRRCPMLHPSLPAPAGPRVPSGPAPRVPSATSPLLRPLVAGAR
jgi:hypothetical protein